MVEVSKFGVDVVKSARLLLAPLQLAASFQDRLEIYFKNLNARVSEESMVQVPAELSSVCLDKMKYIDCENPLWLLFEELLINASSSETQSLVHPSFATIISQLSPDEAILLYELSLGDFDIEYEMDLDRETHKFNNRRDVLNTTPLKLLVSPESFNIYYSHLNSLSLVTWPKIDEKPINDKDHPDPHNKQVGTWCKSKITLTEFGGLFVKAVIPKNGFAKNS
jgi:hypothetical protein